MTGCRAVRSSTVLSVLALLILATSSHAFVQAQAFVASTNIAGNAFGIAYDSGKSELFVSVQNSDYFNDINSILVISDTDNKVVGNISLSTDASPAGIAYDSARGEVFVANSTGDDVLIISDASDKIIKTVSVGNYPYSVAYDATKGEIFVGSGQSGPGVVSVISDTTDSVIATIPVGADPYSMTYDPSKGEIFVSNEGSASVSGSVSVVSDSSNSVIATIPLADAGESVYDPALGEVVVVTPDSDSAAVISDATDSVVGTESAGPHPFSIAYDSGKGEIFVSNPLNDTLTVISGASTTSSSASTKASSTSLTSPYLLIVAADVVMIGILGALAPKRARVGPIT